MRRVSARARWAALLLLLAIIVADGAFAAGPKERDFRSRLKHWAISIMCRLGTPGGCT